MYMRLEFTGIQGNHLKLDLHLHGQLIRSDSTLTLKKKAFIICAIKKAHYI